MNELHVNDPEIFLDITNVGSRFLKEPEFYRGISIPRTSIGGCDPMEHKIRRQVLAPAFSISQVGTLSTLIQARINHLCHIFEKTCKAGEPVHIDRGFRSLTLDIISEIIFGKDFGALRSRDLHHPQLDVLRSAIEGAWIYRSFPTVCSISLALPNWLSSRLFPVPMNVFAKVYCPNLAVEVLPPLQLIRSPSRNASRGLMSIYSNGITKVSTRSAFS